MELRDVMFLEDESVCYFKLAANVVRGGVWQFVYEQQTGRYGFNTVVMKRCPFI